MWDWVMVKMAANKRIGKKARKMTARAGSIAAPEKKAGFWDSNARALNGSWQSIFTRNFWMAAEFDLIFLFCALLVFLICASIISRLSQYILPELLQINAQKDLGDPTYLARANEISPYVYKFLWTALGVIVAGFVLFVFILTIFYGKSWSKIQGRQYTGLYFKRLLLINLVWFIIWILIVFLTMGLLSPVLGGMLFVIEMLVFVWCDSILRAMYDESKSLLRNIGGSLRFSLAKVHYFVFFEVILLLLVFIALAILGAFAVYLKILVLPAWMILTLLFTGFLRAYAANIVNN
jgi:hypothetical protein